MLKIFITIPIVMLLIFEIIALGKRITKSNIGFIRNEMAVFAIGFIAYSFTSIAVFFPFFWIQINIIYFVIIFAIKDVILIFILISNSSWGSIIKSFDYKTLFSLLIASVGLVLLFHFVSSKQYTYESINYKNSFNFFGKNWLYIKESISKISFSNLTWTNNWILSFISSMMIYASIGSYIRKYMHLSYIAEFVATLGLAILVVLFFNSKKHITDLAGIFTAFFSIFLVMNLLEHSRRRFGTMFGLAFITAWTIDPQALLIMSSISVTASFVYVYYKKAMIPLFVSLLSIPMFFAFSFLLIQYWIGIPIIMSLILLSLYITFLVKGRNAYFDKIHIWSLKNYKILFLLYAVLFMTAAIFVMSLQKINAYDLLIKSISIFPNGGQSLIILGAILYYLLITITVCIFMALYIFKVKIVRIKLAFTFIAIILAIFYNPIMYSLIQLTPLENGFIYLKYVIYIPFISLFISSVVNVTFELFKLQNFDFTEKIKVFKFLKDNN